MEIQFFGANCIVIGDKKVRLTIDDNLAVLGGKSVLKSGGVLLLSSPTIEPPKKVDPKLVIDGPGEYEVSDVSIQGIAARAHMDASGLTATMYKLVYNDISVLIVGHIFPELSESQLEQIGEVDVMLIPVGGNGYTLDAVGALKLIRIVEPKLVIPTHYSDKSLNYEVPQQSLDQALKDLGMEPKERLTKSKLKPGQLPDITQLIILENAAR